MHKKLSFH